jgi:hypothetical protein
MINKCLLVLVLVLLAGCDNAIDEEYVELEVRDVYLLYDEKGEIKCTVSEDGQKVCLNDSK